jgi:hypothetical protein
MGDGARDVVVNVVCEKCIGDQFLRESTALEFAAGICSYCHGAAKCVAIVHLSELVEQVFDENFIRTPDDPDDWDYAQLKDAESDYWWERAGELVVDIVEEVASVSTAIATDIQQLLESRHYDLELVKMGDELEFSSEARYEEISGGPGDWKIRWDQFRDSLRFESRFFNQTARRFLGEMFDGLDTLPLLDGKSPIIVAGPGTGLPALIRARCFQSPDELLKALARPDVHIGPPHGELARSGRMNARGISVFYGATEDLTAVAEVRPPVGSSVVVARFEIVRPIRLLDLEALCAIWTSGSYFDPSFRPRREREHFLKGLSARLAQAVMPGDEDLEYLATQAVCDYLASNSTLGIDGIAYPSVQRGGDGRNIVLFRKSARLEQIVPPDGETVTAAFGYSGEDDDGGFIVTQHRLGPDEAEQEEESTLRAGAHLPQLAMWNSDTRPITLQIDLESLTVYHVTSVNVGTHRFDVTRWRQGDEVAGGPF